MIIYDIYYYNIIIRGGTVQLFHGSVRITVLESRFRYVSMFMENTILSNKNRK